MNKLAEQEKTYSIDEFISEGATSSLFTYDNFLLKDKDTDTDEIVPIYNLLHDYYDELMAMSVLGVMSDQNYIKYQYRPRLLAYDLYGNTDLYFLLLMLNNISNPKEFTMKKVRLIQKEKINQILSYIYSAEEDNITNNRAKL